MNTPTLTRGRLVRYFLTALAGTLIAWWIGSSSDTHPQGQPRDYEEIVAEGTLRAVTEYGVLTFHAEGDSVDGLLYRMVNEFARDHRLKVTIEAVTEFGEKLQGLAEGKYDLIAAAVPVNSQLRNSLLLSRPILTSRQVLVQRKADSDSDSIYIRSQVDLAQKTLHVTKGSPALLRIHNLASEIGDTIYIREVERYGAEQLMFMVAHGDIDYAVCDESVALAAIDSLPQIDIRTAIGFTQFYAWGTSKQSHALMDSINAWLERKRITPKSVLQKR